MSGSYKGNRNTLAVGTITVSNVATVLIPFDEDAGCRSGRREVAIKKVCGLTSAAIPFTTFTETILIGFRRVDAVESNSLTANFDGVSIYYRSPSDNGFSGSFGSAAQQSGEFWDSFVPD
ncbi:hypothetical protein ROS1_31000 [Roseibium sp. ROS1]